MAVNASSDAERVLRALRLGWAMAELRGRLRPGHKLVHLDPFVPKLRSEHALPLTGERGELEQLIEVEVAVGALAEQRALDFDVNQLTGQALRAGRYGRAGSKAGRGWARGWARGSPPASARRRR